MLPLAYRTGHAHADDQSKHKRTHALRQMCLTRVLPLVAAALLCVQIGFWMCAWKSGSDDGARGVELEVEVDVSNSEPPEQQQRVEQRQQVIHAIVLSNSSARYDFSTGNLEHSFPGLFTFHQFHPVLLSDARINPSLSKEEQRVQSNYWSFVDIYQLVLEGEPFRAVQAEEWVYVFEDDVDVAPPYRADSQFCLRAIWTLMEHERVNKDGVFYLGNCDPKTQLAKDRQPIVHKHEAAADEQSEGGGGGGGAALEMVSNPGLNACLHAVAYKKRELEQLWKYLTPPSPMFARGVASGVYMDRVIPRAYAQQRIAPYVLGSSIEHPPRSAHKGLVFQDRTTYASTITHAQA